MVKLITFVLFIAGSFSALAVEDCGQGPNTGEKILKGVPLTEKICSSVSINKGDAKVERFPKIIYGVLSASSKMKQLFQQLEEKISSNRQNSQQCPEGCRKNSLPTVEILTKPTSTVFEPQCPKEYSRLNKLSSDVEKKFDIGSSQDGKIKKVYSLRGNLKKCQDKATEFAQETLMGSNDFGKYLESEKCKSPCSYSSSIQIKTIFAKDDSCSVELSLDIQCGPPKASREWETSATLQHVLQCEASP